MRVYVLTHFHSDHYMGLGPKWDAGPIFCSRVTARLAATRLRAPKHLLRALPLGVTITAYGVAMVLYDANHCPGAAIFEMWPVGRPRVGVVLHTGDFRAGADFRGAWGSVSTQGGSARLPPRRRSRGRRRRAA